MGYDLSKYQQVEQEILGKKLEPLSALKLSEEAGFEILGIGGSRLVVALSEQLVVKMAWRSSGIADNEIESRLWSAATNDFRSFLAPVDFYDQDSGLSVQSRCQPIEYRPAALPVIAALSVYGIVDGLVNLGLLSGKIVCYDYALLSAERYLSLMD